MTPSELAITISRWPRLTPRGPSLGQPPATSGGRTNAAYALDRGDKVGSTEIGKKADIIVLDIPRHQQPPCWFGDNLVAKVVKNGVTIEQGLGTRENVRCGTLTHPLGELTIQVTPGHQI